MRRFLIVLLPLFLVLSACSAAALDDITVSGGKDPALKGVEEFEVDKTTTRVIKKGDGAEVKDGDTVSVNYLAVNGRTGKEFDSTFATGTPQPITLGDQMLKGFVKALPGQKVGSRILVAIPPADGFDQAMDQYDVKKTDTIVFLFDILDIQAREASGKAQKLPESVPQITLDKDNHPSGVKATSATPKQAVKGAHVAIAGTGAAVTKGQTVSVQYVGQKYPDGEKFDSSWDRGAPFSFQAGVGGVIACWDQLVGQKVGSRVVLICPSATAYGDKPSGGQPAGALVFVVDLLGAV